MARDGPPVAGDARADHDATGLDSDLRAPAHSDNQGSDHLGRPNHHTDASTNHDQSEDHREPGDLRQSHHLAVATRKCTIYRFQR